MRLFLNRIKNQSNNCHIFLIILFLIFSKAYAEDHQYTEDQCVKIALENSKIKKISELHIELAENRYQQVLSSFYPILKFRFTGAYLNNNVQFIVPEAQIPLNQQFVELQATAIAQSQLSLQGISADTIGQDAYAAALDQTKSQIAGSMSTIDVPKQEIDVTSEYSGSGMLEMNYPLYWGGKRFYAKNIHKQIIEKVRHIHKRTEIDLVYDIKKAYGLALLADDLQKILNDLSDEVKVSLDIIEKTYKEGKDLGIKKNDYLAHKLLYDQVNLMKKQIEVNRKIAYSALAFQMGLPFTESVKPIKESIQKDKEINLKLDTLIDEMQKSSPDLLQMKNDVQIQLNKIKLAQSDYFPKLALFGQMGFIDNNKDIGVILNDKMANYTIGFSLEIPIFSGFETQKKIAESKLELTILEKANSLKLDAFKFQLKMLTDRLFSTKSEIDDIKNNLNTAEELLEAETALYFGGDAKKWQDVIKTQVFSGMIKGQEKLKSFERKNVGDQIEKLIGNEVYRQVK